MLNRSYEVFAPACGFEIDPCRPATGSDKGKAERGGRTLRSAFGEVLRRGAGSLEELHLSGELDPVSLRWSYFVGQSEGDLKVDSDGLQSPRGPA